MISEVIRGAQRVAGLYGGLPSYAGAQVPSSVSERCASAANCQRTSLGGADVRGKNSNMTTVRIIFEKGLEFGVAAKNSIRLLDCRDFKSIAEEMRSRYNVRPVLTTERYQSTEIDRLLTLDASTCLGLRLSYMDQGVPQLFTSARLSLLMKSMTLQYVLGSTIYHCQRLALAYSIICSEMLKFSSIRGWSPTSESGLGGQNHAYYEFDALVTAARRSYDATRFILWDVFGPGGKHCPRNYQTALNACRNLPVALKQRLQQSWSQYGKKLTEYRDCVQHYIPVDFGQATASMKKLDGDVWTAELRIPDNPEVRSKRLFQYTAGLDALTYGWEITNEVVTLAADIMGAIPPPS